MRNGTEINQSHGNYLFLPKHIAMQLTGLLYDYQGLSRKINEVKKK